MTTEAERLIEAKTSPRSVSQVQLYDKCAYAWYLRYVALDVNGEKIWDRPAAWLPMGTAVHAAAEVWERSSRSMPLEAAQEAYVAVYVEETDKYLSKATMDTWSHSGPYNGEADIERRFTIGLDHVRAYIDYFTTGKGSKDVVWIADDGTPGLELGFEFDLDGVAVRGYVDAVYQTPGGLVVSDTKTGIHPGDEFQLGTYGVALREVHGLAVQRGQFFMTRKGKPTAPIDLFEIGREEISSRYAVMDAAVKAEKFDPSPDPEKCGRCGFNSYCPFVAF